MTADADVEGLLTHVGEVLVGGHLLAMAFDDVGIGAVVIWICFEDLCASLWRCDHHSGLWFEGDGDLDVVTG